MIRPMRVLFVGSACFLGLMTACSSSSRSLAVAAETSGPERVYVGTYTGPKSKGIQLVQLDTATGALSAPELVGETESPSSLAVRLPLQFTQLPTTGVPDLNDPWPFLAVNEMGNVDGKGAGGVSAFSLNLASGKLTFLNQQTSGGGGPCYVGLDPAAKHALVANYGSGSFEVLPIGSDGKLGSPSAFIQDKDDSGAEKPRQPHAHWIGIDPSGKYALACDLGLDSVFVFHFDADKGTLTPADPPAATVAPGSGPRHLAFSNDGKFAYVLTELKSTVVVFKWDAGHGTLHEVQTLSSLSPDSDGKQTASAEIRIHPSGKFLYATNRGDGTIAVFDIDPASGKLTAKAFVPSIVKGPRGMNLDPSGNWLLVAGQYSDNLVSFKIDPGTGLLTKAAQIDVGGPVDVLFVDGKEPRTK